MRAIAFAALLFGCSASSPSIYIPSNDLSSPADLGQPLDMFGVDGDMAQSHELPAPVDMAWQPLDLADCQATSGACCPGERCAAGYTCVDNGCNPCGLMNQFCCGKLPTGTCSVGTCTMLADPTYGACK